MYIENHLHRASQRKDREIKKEKKKELSIATTCAYTVYLNISSVVGKHKVVDLTIHLNRDRDKVLRVRHDTGL